MLRVFSTFFKKIFTILTPPKNGHFLKFSWTLDRVLRPPIGIYPAKIARFPHFLQNASPFYQKKPHFCDFFAEFSRFWGIFRAKKPRRTRFYRAQFFFCRKLVFCIFDAKHSFSLKCSFLQKSHFR
jgi:hypothetical protein